MVSGKSETAISDTAPVSQSLSIYSINIKCLLAHLAELSFHLSVHKPHIVLIQDSWLNKSIEHVSIANYTLLSRRDRSETENRGGVIAFVRNLDIGGSFALCNWYRSPSASDNKTHSFREELAEIQDQVIGFIILGDLNVHHIRWLRYSSGTSREGIMLKSVCDDFALKQLVSEPTRGEYLLDLCLTDLDACKVKTSSAIADHEAIIAEVKLPVAKCAATVRNVWHYKGAAWQNMKCILKACSWHRLRQGSVNEAFDYFMDLLMSLCHKYIPSTTIQIQNQTHPWLTQACAEAIEAKNQATAGADFTAARDKCATVLNNAYKEYTAKLKARIAQLPRGSKQWWSLNRELLNKKARLSSVPPLRDSNGLWLMEPKAKADLFASTWHSKSTLPDPVEDQFVPRPEHTMCEFIAIRTRTVEHELKNLDTSKATGPDRILAY